MIQVAHLWLGKVRARSISIGANLLGSTVLASRAIGHDQLGPEDFVPSRGRSRRDTYPLAPVATAIPCARAGGRLVEDVGKLTAPTSDTVEKFIALRMSMRCEHFCAGFWMPPALNSGPEVSHDR